MEASDAYRHCEQIVRTRARNFAYGIRLLRPPERAALSAVYAFARRVDDIGDGDDPPQVRLAGLADVRAQLAVLDRPGADVGDDPVLIALADAATHYPIPLAAFSELIDGCEADVRGTSYESIEDLVGYCRLVAGSIGRLSLGVFGASDLVKAEPLADALGVALQLTNILRDIREDLHNGRVYLPKRDLALFGCDLTLRPDGLLDPQDGALAEVIRFEAARAWGWYDRGLGLLAVLDRRSAACCAAMAGIYHELLGRIAARPELVMAGRTSLPARDKLRVATRSLARPGVRHG